MTHARRFLTLSLGLALAAPAAHAQTALSAGSAVTAALNSSSDVRTAQANLAKAQAASRAAQADPSTLVAAKLSAAHAETLAQAGLRGAKLSALQSAIGAYTALLEAQENVELQTLQVQVDQRNAQINQLKAEIAQLQTQLDTTTKQKQTLQSAVQAITTDPHWKGVRYLAPWWRQG